jgi:ABC-type multidrug transport system ATPase subunit
MEAGRGSAGPGEPAGDGSAAVEFAVSFEDVIVNLRKHGERERILGPATGCVRSGQVLAVVGPAHESGVLLNALRGVYNFSSSPVANSMGEGVHVGGTITWNGQKPQDVDPRVLAYIDFENPDTIPGAVTCWEVLAYTIKVRVTFLSATEQIAMVDQVLDMLSLAEFAHTPYGLLLPSQQRLARIAREVVGCAGIVFLHDPCNGLSAMDSVELLKTLLNLAQKHGYAITVSLPELPPGLVSVLSQVLVLATDGRVAYQGPVSRAAAWFSVQGFDKRSDFSHKTPHDLVPLYAEFSTGDLLVHGIRLLPQTLLDTMVVANADSDALRATRRSAVEIRTGRVALPALVERDGMPAIEPGDLRWLFALFEWEFTMMRKDALALHRCVCNYVDTHSHTHDVPVPHALLRVVMWSWHIYTYVYTYVCYTLLRV